MSGRSERQWLRPLWDYQIHFGMILGFLYNLAIASRFNSEADIEDLHHVCSRLQTLEKYVESEEARFRLEQIEGLFRLYSRSRKIDVLTPTPQNEIPITDRLDDFFDESEIAALSKNRHLLGFPSKCKIAIVRIRRGVRRIAANKRYMKWLSVSNELARLPNPPIEVSAGLGSLRTILAFQTDAYNPPLVDLSHFRYKTVKDQLATGEEVAMRFLRSNTYMYRNSYDLG